MGVKNKYAKAIVGFALDVALDPTTYFGGTAIKYSAKTAGKALRPIGAAYAKVAPESAYHFIESANNLKDAIGKGFVYGYGASKGLPDDVAKAFNKMGIAKEDIIESNKILFGKGYADDEIIEATDLIIKNRRAERAMKEQLKKQAEGSIDSTQNAFQYSKNQKVNELMEKMKNKGAEIAEKGNIEKTYNWYYPFIDKTKLGKRYMDESSNWLKVGKEGYKKEFRDLIKDENLLKKPIEAYSRREYEVVRNGIIKQTLGDIITAYGKPTSAYKNIAEAAVDNYVPVYEKSPLRFFKSDPNSKLLNVAKSKPIGYLKEADSKFINNHLFPEMKTLDVLAKTSGYDTFTRWFKTAVTSWFPAFHARNYISGNIQNYSVLGSGAFNPTNHNIALKIMKNLGGKGNDELIELGGVKYGVWALANELKKNFQGASRYISDIGKYIEEGASGSFKLAPIKDPGRQLGNFIEMNQKAVAVVTALKQGKTLKDAIKLAETSGFDYSKITQFESKVLRRLIPFYSFARKNAELQLKTLAKNPERIINQVKMTNALSTMFGGGVTEEDLGGLPSWVLEGLGFKVEGNRYLSSFGLPIEEFLQRVNAPLMSSLTSLNPIIKYPLESKTGYDFFREKKITDVNKIDVSVAEKLPKSVQEFMNIRFYTYKGKEYASADPSKLHILRNLPTARLQNTLEKFFDKDMNKVDKVLAFASGAKIYDIDKEMQKYFREKELREDLERELLQKGIGNEYTNFYIYK